MRRRYLETAIDELCFADGKMALVSGPRQCGKTTFAKMLLRQRGSGAYHNWDQAELRRLWAKSPQATVEVARRGDVRPLVVLDEIHKAKLWKRDLKGIYDTLRAPTDILVTGSARLAVYRKGSDSLMGRARSFRLHPFSAGELEPRRSVPRPEEALERVFRSDPAARPRARVALERLLALGPFPEPLFARDERKARLWRQSRLDAVVREDLRDLTRIHEIDRVQMLAALLPERVASPLSVQSLREILEVAHDTARRWLTVLAELYYSFEVKPYARSISRSIRKEGKLYLWDWGEVRAPGPRFENLVAAHLLKSCHFWTDTGEGAFTLHCVRDKDQKEIDFLIARDGEPWLPVEVKLSEAAPSPAWWRFLPRLGCARALQIALRPGVRELRSVGPAELLVASAEDVLRHLV